MNKDAYGGLHKPVTSEKLKAVARLLPLLRSNKIKGGAANQPFERMTEKLRSRKVRVYDST